MGLFDNLKLKRELERLEEAVRKSPSPANYCALIKKYRDSEEKDKAEKALFWAQQGIEQFPDADDVFELYFRLRKTEVQKEIETLTQVIQTRPTPVAYAQLAEIYKDLREEETALKYCRQAIQKFPQDDSPYLIIGQLRLRRFYKDYIAKDGHLALENLEKASQINSRNYKSLLSMAKLYLQIGALTKARQKLKNILLFAPEDGDVKNLIELSTKIPKPAHEDVDILLQIVEQERKLYHYLDTTQQESVSSPPVEEIVQALESCQNILEKNAGILCLLICDKDGNLISHYAREGADFNTYYEVASSIFQNVQDSSRQMDFGRFQRGQIEGPFGNICLIGTKGIAFTSFCTPAVKPEQNFKYLQKLVNVIAKVESAT